MLWVEIVLDSLAILFIAIGIGFVYPPAGLIVAGIGIAALSIGIRARYGRFGSNRLFKAIEVEDR